VKQVSVIVPVHNDPAGLTALLRALLVQTCAREQFEIIVVDNDSRDATAGVAAEYQQRHPDLIRVLAERSAHNSYAARNTGIKHAQADVLALVDADCRPVPEWIDRGLAALHSQAADLVAGKVTLVLSSRPSAAEMYDRMQHFQIAQSVAQRGAAPTANLFVRRGVFESIGMFPTHVSSGADAIWTGNATKAGFKTVYDPQLEVLHSTRGFAELLKKHYRLGGGQPAIWRARGHRGSRIAMAVLSSFLPMRVDALHALIRERGTPEMERQFWAIWWIAWLGRVVMNLGRISTFLQPRRG
jgi:glycosyltransferase involved in cell wall biosynthesis